MVEYSLEKDRINETGSYILVKWFCANKKILMRTKILGRMNVRAQKKEQMKETHICWSNGRVQIKEINQ